MGLEGQAAVGGPGGHSGAWSEWVSEGVRPEHLPGLLAPPLTEASWGLAFSIGV